MGPYIDKNGLHCECGSNNLELYALKLGMKVSFVVRCIDHPENVNELCSINQLAQFIEAICTIEDPKEPNKTTIDTALKTKLCGMIREQLLNAFSEEIRNNAELKQIATAEINKRFA